ncbi:MAG: PorV/PorQ family protein [Elusimicrobia bacterium]|nr:PorV/PorQ family protein [Elusimicrobiota bacterium]
MKNRRALAALTAAALLAGGPARAATDPGVTGAPVLQVPLGARALGMGGAFTAVATDASALQYNPAGLARLNAHEVDFTYIAGAGESSLQHLAYAGPTPLTGVSGNGYTTAAASALFSQSGTIQVNTLRSDGSLQSTQNLSAGSDMVLTGGYAERVGMTPIELKDGTYNVDHFFGVGGKYLRSTLVESYHATAFAADVGYLAHSPEAGWSAGVAGLNLGGKLRYLQQADPLPATVRGGVAWQGGVPSVHNLIAAVDGDYVIDEKLWHVNAGVEYFWIKSYGLRLGYRFHYGDQGGLTIGLGYRWKGRLLLDYAYDLGDLLGNGQRVTLSYRFGGVPPSVRGRQRRPFIETAPEHEEMPDLQQRQPVPDDAPRPRPVPRERPQGAPGWIY